MKPPEHQVGLPLDYAAEVAFELHLMRGECSDAAGELLENLDLDEAALEECALLDEALREAHRIMGGAVAGIRRLRASRTRPD